jgi:CheY-like chemotaxis protein
MSGASSGAAKHRVLVVEDELLLGILLEGMLTELGHEVATIAPRVSNALAAVESESFDLAILDVRLQGESVVPVADALAAKGLPFMFATGYGRNGLPEAYRGKPVLQKPFSQSDLRRALDSLAVPTHQGSA